MRGHISHMHTSRLVLHLRYLTFGERVGDTDPAHQRSMPWHDAVEHQLEILGANPIADAGYEDGELVLTIVSKNPDQLWQEIRATVESFDVLDGSEVWIRGPRTERVWSS